MLGYKVSYPSNNKELPQVKNFSELEQFFGDNYTPHNINNWNDFLLTPSQSECRFSDYSDMKVQEYIDTVLLKYPDLSFATLDNMSDDERICLVDMLMKMNFNKIAKTFGGYIFLFMIFMGHGYPHGRFESYLIPYLKKYPEYINNIGVDTCEIIREASHRLGLYKTSFGEKMFLYKLYTALSLGLYDKTYNTILQKFITDKSLLQNITIGQIRPVGTSPCGKSEWFGSETKNIQKNETYYNNCYLDAPIALGIYYQGLPIAMISGMRWNRNEFVIYQMQSISSKVYNGYGVYKGDKTHPIITTIPWQKILHESMYATLLGEGIEQIYIQPGSKNYRTEKMLVKPEWNENHKDFTEIETDIPHLSKKIAHEIYDVFAEDNGYIQDMSDFWRKSNTSQNN